jgi:cytochrome c-type biogenesis protein CcsB
LTPLFNLSLIVYCAALILAAVNLFSKEQRRFASAATVVLTVGAIAQSIYIVLRWLEAGRAPFGNMFESLVLFAWAIVVTFLALRTRLHIPVLGAATALLALMALAYASSFESKIEALMPALRSNWLTFHVLTCFLGYGGFALSFVASVSYLVAVHMGNRFDPEVVAGLELVGAKTNAFGFLFLTIGILSGAVWANSAWGSYWSWDPKETWSLITWFIYAVFLHCRFMRGWSGRRAAWVSVAGFASVVFTYFGVNYVLSGLHSYAK